MGYYYNGIYSKPGAPGVAAPPERASSRRFRVTNGKPRKKKAAIPEKKKSSKKGKKG